MQCERIGYYALITKGHREPGTGTAHINIIKFDDNFCVVLVDNEGGIY
jgi:hypothetical protein